MEESIELEIVKVNLSKKRIILYVLCSFALSFLYFVVISDCYGSAWFFAVYDKLRASLFTGYLTVGSFLLSLKSMILQKVYEIYDDEVYTKQFVKEQSKEQTDKYTVEIVNNIYIPLVNLNQLLLNGIALSLFTSICQLTLGMFNNKYLLSLCLAFAIATLVCLYCVWYIVKCNMKQWLVLIKIKKLKKKKSD
ncbi:MAG: hypothetical protein U0Y96_12470 [Candidatus Kapaibacterium sp.]|nr:hypothetical protein [Bacteroidota bacterium]